MTKSHKDKNRENARLIAGSGFIDPTQPRPETAADVDLNWNLYKQSGDVECLARAIENTNICGNHQITKEIAKHLRDREPTQKLQKTRKNIEEDVLYKHLLKSGMRKEDIYTRLAPFLELKPESVKRKKMRQQKKSDKKIIF